MTTDEYLTQVSALGVTELKMKYRAGWWGRVAFQKEVGPPPWKFSHLYVAPSLSKRGGRCIQIGLGWRSTLYTVTYMAKRYKNKNEEGY